MNKNYTAQHQEQQNGDDKKEIHLCSIAAMNVWDREFSLSDKLSLQIIKLLPEVNIFCTVIKLSFQKTDTISFPILLSIQAI